MGRMAMTLSELVCLERRIAPGFRKSAKDAVTELYCHVKI
jgi:hypothetical protein